MAIGVTSGGGVGVSTTASVHTITTSTTATPGVVKRQATMRTVEKGVKLLNYILQTLRLAPRMLQLLL